MQGRSNDRRKIVISPEAKEDIENILSYLNKNWGNLIVQEFLQKLNTFYYIVSVNPRLLDFITSRKIFVSI